MKPHRSKSPFSKNLLKQKTASKTAKFEKLLRLMKNRLELLHFDSCIPRYKIHPKGHPRCRYRRDAYRRESATILDRKGTAGKW